MRVGQAFPSKFLKADDLQGRDVTATIEEVVLEKVGRDNQYVVYFQGKRKGMVMYSQQANEIAKTLGDDEMDNWAGQQITLYASRNENGKDYIHVKERSAVDSGRHQQSQQQEQPFSQQAPAQSQAAPNFNPPSRAVSANEAEF